MYTLQVFLPNQDHPHHVEHVRDAAAAMARISVLLHEHAGCERVVVSADSTRLFSVDCEGNTRPG